MSNEIDGLLQRGRLQRRSVMQAALVGLGGLLGLGGFPFAVRQALAVPSDPGAGPLVTPNPINDKIGQGQTVTLVDFSTPPRSQSKKPYSLLNYLYHAGDGTGRVFANDSRGKLWLINGKTGAAQLFLDLKAVRGKAFKPDKLQMGLRSFAFHPDFARTGRPGYRKLYTMSTESTGSKSSGVKVFGGPFKVLFHDVLAEWSVDPKNPARVDPKSRREILRIAQYKSDHNTDQLVFDPRAKPGEAAYGKLFMGIGDGGNTPEHPDMFDQAQNRGQALGKIFRIDPLKQKNGARYGVPAGNPFVGQTGYMPEIWALGLRHPQNLSFDQGGSGTFLVSDIGQAQIEEINLGVKGANYGWPLREGPFVTERLNEANLYALPTDDAAKGFTYPVAMYDHDEGLAVAGGFVYRGSAVPALVGHYIFGDLVNGRVFHVPVADLALGKQATVRELVLQQGGVPVTLLKLVGASRADLRFGQDQAGEVYILTKQDGKIRKLAA